MLGLYSAGSGTSNLKETVHVVVVFHALSPRPVSGSSTPFHQKWRRSGHPCVHGQHNHPCRSRPTSKDGHTFPPRAARAARSRSRRCQAARLSPTPPASTSFGVAPPSDLCGLCSWYQTRYRSSSRSMSEIDSGRRIRRKHSFFRLRMKRSMRAMLPVFPTAPKRVGRRASRTRPDTPSGTASPDR